MQLDYDLRACLEYNPQDGFTAKDIVKVLAVYEGENDRANWRWILLLDNGRYVYLVGGCDYTGWDCQSWAESRFANNPEAAANIELTIYELGNDLEVHQQLTTQLAEGKTETWRETKDKEFGLSKTALELAQADITYLLGILAGVERVLKEVDLSDMIEREVCILGQVVYPFEVGQFKRPDNE